MYNLGQMNWYCRCAQSSTAVSNSKEKMIEVGRSTRQGKTRQDKGPIGENKKLIGRVRAKAATATLCHLLPTSRLQTTRIDRWRKWWKKSRKGNSRWRIWRNKNNKQDQTELDRSARWSGQWWSRGGPTPTGFLLVGQAQGVCIQGPGGSTGGQKGSQEERAWPQGTRGSRGEPKGSQGERGRPAWS